MQEFVAKPYVVDKQIDAPLLRKFEYKKSSPSLIDTQFLSCLGQRSFFGGIMNKLVNASIFIAGNLFLATQGTAATFIIDFENVPVGETSGPLVFSDGVVTATLERFIADTSVVDITQAEASRDLARFGTRSISSFNDGSAGTPYQLRFSQPVRSVRLSAGDFGQDEPDRARLFAYAPGDEVLSFNSVDIDTANIRTLSGDRFNSNRLEVSDPGLIGAVEFSGGTDEFPHSLFYDNIVIEYPDFDGQSLIASSEGTIVGGFRSAFSINDEGGLVERYSTAVREAQDCASFGGIDCENFQEDLRQANIGMVREVATITESIAPLAFRTSVVPTSEIEIIADIDTLINESIEVTDLLLDTTLPIAGGIIDNVVGTISSFTINPSFDVYDVSFDYLVEDLLVSPGLDDFFRAGNQQVSVFSEDSSLGRGFGFFSVEGVSFAGNDGMLNFNFQYVASDDEEISPVPLPASGLLLGFGLAFLSFSQHRRKGA